MSNKLNKDLKQSRFMIKGIVLSIQLNQLREEAGHQLSIRI
jgi:hypothetical protein